MSPFQRCSDTKSVANSIAHQFRRREPHFIVAQADARPEGSDNAVCDTIFLRLFRGASSPNDPSFDTVSQSGKGFVVRLRRRHGATLNQRPCLLCAALVRRNADA
jgi:hypothetical protein